MPPVWQYRANTGVLRRIGSTRRCYNVVFLAGCAVNVAVRMPDHGSVWLTHCQPGNLFCRCLATYASRRDSSAATSASGMRNCSISSSSGSRIDSIFIYLEGGNILKAGCLARHLRQTYQAHVMGGPF